ncbi:ABC transporter substrate-binding protein [Corynebacterium urinipleomorphum]|uniref:ABC transporter substrate-binding protein n=1 Tax=Corynebacterium urinipleomorphum TaxID=1852380 RepID=UPI001F26C50C|nr:ABC transporter substrate-binding protein [Corynebacterium urinipleomorphum]
MKRLTVLVSAFAAAAAFSACSAETQDPGSASSSSTSASQSSGDFQPVTIEHALGTAEIKEKPERIVTIGQGSAELAIAMGHTPVAIQSYAWGADESGYLPWIKEAVEERGDELPEQFEGDDALSAEKVLGYKPDLILAPWSGITQDQYDQLSKIAPTVAYEKEPWTITWEEQVDVVAKALGEPEKAQSVKDDVAAAFKENAEEEYGNYTFSYIYNDGPQNLGIFLPGEQRVAFVSNLGLKVDDVYKQFPVTPGTDSAQLSKENADALNSSDLIFTFYTDEANREEMHKDPVYSRIRAIENGAEVAATDQSLVTASSIINPLTVRWAAPRFKELIDSAVANAHS